MDTMPDIRPRQHLSRLLGIFRPRREVKPEANTTPEMAVGKLLVSDHDPITKEAFDRLYNLVDETAGKVSLADNDGLHRVEARVPDGPVLSLSRLALRGAAKVVTIGIVRESQGLNTTYMLRNDWGNAKRPAGTATLRKDSREVAGVDGIDNAGVMLLTTSLQKYLETAKLAKQPTKPTRRLS